MASTPACHQMVFITCFVLTSIQYEWKSIFHLDQIVSLLRQHRRSSPELRRSGSASPPLPPHSCILYLITCVSGPRRQVYEALGNYSWEGELGGGGGKGGFTGGICPTGGEWCLQIRFGGDAVTQTVAAAGAVLLLAPRGKSPRSNLCCQVGAAIKLVSLVTGLHCIISQAS